MLSKTVGNIQKGAIEVHEIDAQMTYTLEFRIIIYVHLFFLREFPLYTALIGPVRLLFSGISTLYEPYLGLYNYQKKNS